MTQLTYPLPVISNPFSTEAPKVGTALQDIQTVINSELTADNMPTVLTCAMTQPTRSLATAYQPNTTRPTYVTVIINSSGTNDEITASIGSSSSPTTVVAASAAANSVAPQSLSFIVPVAWYYELKTPGLGGGVIQSVTEWAL